MKTSSRLRVFFAVAAPYVAVVVGLYVFRSAWLSILLYHAQILLLRPGSGRNLIRGWDTGGFLLFALPAMLAGPLVYFLFGHMVRPDTSLQMWMSGFGLSNAGLLLMVPYFGLAHPTLEQWHWRPLCRGDSPGSLAHVLFAGYHALVLISLLKPAWVAVCVLILVGASVLWTRMERRFGGALVPALSHALADLSIIGTVCWMK